jgi:hypothetical protein
VTYYFTPPTVEEGPAGMNRLFWRYRLNRADTVLLNQDGTYSHYRSPGIEELEAAVRFYQGGHIYPITSEERTSLINGGYGANITEE